MFTKFSQFPPLISSCFGDADLSRIRSSRCNPSSFPSESDPSSSSNRVVSPKNRRPIIRLSWKTHEVYAVVYYCCKANTNKNGSVTTIFYLTFLSLGFSFKLTIQSESSLVIRIFFVLFLLSKYIFVLVYFLNRELLFKFACNMKEDQ